MALYRSVRVLEVNSCAILSHLTESARGPGDLWLVIYLVYFDKVIWACKVSMEFKTRRVNFYSLLLISHLRSREIYDNLHNTQFLSQF